jgi:hypothetical protein
MPSQMDFSSAHYADGILTMSLAPSANIGGWNIRFQVLKRFEGAVPIVTRYAASGYGGGQSGITVTNSGQGVMNITLASQDFSGYSPGLFTYGIERMDSGSRTMLTYGFINVTPSEGV